MAERPEIEDLAQRLVAGDRRALARAITLVESGRADHRTDAIALGELVARLSGNRVALRIGLTGTPGVGKSTFTEAFGTMLTARGLKVAVLAVDPSSARSGGSILGDKTRMERLSRDPNAFVRPSPSQAALGGVARRTREVTALCEAAGYDVVVIETVGVGQSETLVAEIADVFVLLIAPAGGDELQGVKRGIMELADMILVNKADGDLKAAAMRTVGDYSGALRLIRRPAGDPEGFPSVSPVSAVTGEGLEKVWHEISRLVDARRQSGAFSAHRSEAARRAFVAEVQAGLMAWLGRRDDVSTLLTDLGQQVAAGRHPDGAAAEALRRIESGMG